MSHENVMYSIGNIANHVLLTVYDDVTVIS